MNSKPALATKVTAYPFVSNSNPPSVDPKAIDSWITATIRPPPASASLGKLLVSQAHQPTGLEVAIKKQSVSNITSAAAASLRANVK